MNQKELKELFSKHNWKEKSALIEYQDKRGIAIETEKTVNVLSYQMSLN